MKTRTSQGLVDKENPAKRADWYVSSRSIFWFVNDFYLSSDTFQAWRSRSSSRRHHHRSSKSSNNQSFTSLIFLKTVSLSHASCALCIQTLQIYPSRRLSPIHWHGPPSHQIQTKQTTNQLLPLLMLSRRAYVLWACGGLVHLDHQDSYQLGIPPPLMRRDPFHPTLAFCNTASLILSLSSMASSPNLNHPLPVRLHHSSSPLPNIAQFQSSLCMPMTPSPGLLFYWNVFIIPGSVAWSLNHVLSLYCISLPSIPYAKITFLSHHSTICFVLTPSL